jgi:hypothetical protein
MAASRTSAPPAHRPHPGRRAAHHGIRVTDASGPGRCRSRPGLSTCVVVKGGRLRGEGLCEASAERSSPQAMGEARGHRPLHCHALYNRPDPAGIPAPAGQANTGRELTPAFLAVRSYGCIRHCAACG